MNLEHAAQSIIASQGLRVHGLFRNFLQEDADTCHLYVVSFVE